MADESWRPVLGWEGLYEVSDHGRVRSLDRYAGGHINRRHSFKPGRILVQSSVFRGRLMVQLRHRNRIEKKLVHRLVAEAFIGPCPEGMQCCHNDGNHLNNHASNLRWDSQSANQFDRVKHGGSHTANRTHCPRGHEYTRENTYRNKRGWRQCRECGRRKCAEYRSRRRGVEA